MTEIPEHLRRRAQEARGRYGPTPPEPKTVEVPVEKLELLKEWVDRRQDTPFTSDGLNVVALFHDLIALIPKPAYEPDVWLVQEYAYAQDCSTDAARDELIRLHNAGLTVTMEKP